MTFFFLFVDIYCVMYSLLTAKKINGKTLKQCILISLNKILIIALLMMKNINAIAYIYIMLAIIIQIYKFFQWTETFK